MSDVFKLPDLMPAPQTDIGDMARRLIADRNLSVVRPLYDALVEAVRPEDARAFLRIIRHGCAFTFCEVPGRQLPQPRFRSWGNAARDLAGLFWFDLFDMTESLAAWETALAKADEAVRAHNERMARIAAQYASEASDLVDAVPLSELQDALAPLAVEDPND